MSVKVGVGVITCNRPDFLNNLLSSLVDCKYDELVIVNDGDLLTDIDTSPSYTLLQNKDNLGVCKSKNKAMQHLLDRECDYIFLIEDDMKLIKDDILETYIDASKKTGLQHMMFGYHGPANKGNISKGKPKPRKIIDYGDVQIALNQHCVGAFCFYTRECLEKVGLNNELFDKNNFEHVEHSYRLAKEGYSTPYWWWADIANSMDYIEEQSCVDERSAIRQGDWQEHIESGALLFKKLHGYLPAWKGCVPDTPVDEVISFLRDIKK